MLTTIIILTFLALLGTALVAILYSRILYSQMQFDRLRALYLAEAGIAKSIWELRYDTDLDHNGTGNIVKTELDQGYFWAEHDFQNATITATGEFNRVQRTVQIQYTAI
ncbi:hypothetical protein IID04_00315 [PVC group bacterium]|nr:hypothetical protein [PVC group bacterium]